MIGSKIPALVRTTSLVLEKLSGLEKTSNFNSRIHWHFWNQRPLFLFVNCSSLENLAARKDKRLETLTSTKIHEFFTFSSQKVTKNEHDVSVFSTFLTENSQETRVFYFTRAFCRQKSFLLSDLDVLLLSSHGYSSSEFADSQINLQMNLGPK